MLWKCLHNHGGLLTNIIELQHQSIIHFITLTAALFLWNIDCFYMKLSEQMNEEYINSKGGLRFDFPKTSRSQLKCWVESIRENRVNKADSSKTVKNKIDGWSWFVMICEMCKCVFTFTTSCFTIQTCLIQIYAFLVRFRWQKPSG